MNPIKSGLFHLHNLQLLKNVILLIRWEVVTIYSLNAVLKIPHIWHMSYKGIKSTEAPPCLVFWYFHTPITSLATGSWQSPLVDTESSGPGASHHIGLVDLHHLSRMRQLSFHSSAHDPHSFSPKLLSQLRNQPHCLLRCLGLKQHRRALCH